MHRQRRSASHGRRSTYVRAHRARALSARPTRSCAAPRTTPTPSSRRASRPIRSTPRSGGISCRRRWTGSAELTRSAATASSATTAIRRPSTVVVSMGSGAEVARETVDLPRRTQGEKVGALQVLLYRPFPVEAFLAAAMPSDRADRSPCSTAARNLAPPASRSTRMSPIACAGLAHVTGRVDPARHRRSLRPCRRRSSTPAWCKRRAGRRPPVAAPRDGFSVGIDDDVSGLSVWTGATARHRAGGHDARRLLRPWRGWHRRRQQEQREDHRRHGRAVTRRATSSTIRTSPARRRSRTCASAPKPITAHRT